MTGLSPGQAGPPPKGGSPQPDDCKSAVRSDAAAGLDMLTRLLEGCHLYSPTSSRSSFVLSVTSVMLTGTASLAVKAKQLLPVTGDQAVKFGNYLMSRKSVQQPKGAFHLLEAVMTMANNPQHVPLVIALASPVSVPAGTPMLLFPLLT